MFEQKGVISYCSLSPLVKFSQELGFCVSSYEDDISIKIVLDCLISSGGVGLYASQKGVLMVELSH
jgi:hypothetical protein